MTVDIHTPLIGEAVKASWGRSVADAINLLRKNPVMPSTAAVGHTVRWTGFRWETRAGLPVPEEGLRPGQMTVWDAPRGVWVGVDVPTGHQGAVLPDPHGGDEVLMSFADGSASGFGPMWTDFASRVRQAAVRNILSENSEYIAPSMRAVNDALGSRMVMPGWGSPGDVLQSYGNGMVGWAANAGGGGGGGGGGRNWLSGHEVGSNVDFPYGSTPSLGIGTVRAPGYPWVGFAKVYLNISAKGLEHDARIRIRLWRHKDGNSHNYTGHQDFAIHAGDSRMSHVWYFTGEPNTDVGVDFERSAGWTVTAQTRFLYVFFIERNNHRALAGLPEVDEPEIDQEALGDGLRYMLPTWYMSVNATTKVIEQRLTTLAWANDPNDTAAIDLRKDMGHLAWPTGKSATFGDDASAHWDGTKFVAGVAP